MTGSPAPTTPDPHNLARFVTAQEPDYAQARAELQAGRKTSHWIWYVLPQLRGLGTSRMSGFYGIASAREARAYLSHPVLGTRLRECITLLLDQRGRSAAAILGDVDAQKLQSCLTLFATIAPDEPLFAAALDQFYGGVRDVRTLALLA